MLPNFSQDSLEANYSLPINWLRPSYRSAFTDFLRGQVGRYRNLFIETRQPQASGTLSVPDDPLEEPVDSDTPQSSILKAEA